jgi:hypothetical protein
MHVAMGPAVRVAMGVGVDMGHRHRGPRNDRARTATPKRCRGDAVDVADLGHRLALQPGRDRGEHRHGALQRQRGGEGPERQARGEAGAMRHGVIVGESKQWFDNAP